MINSLFAASLAFFENEDAKIIQAPKTAKAPIKLNGIGFK
jgi:hypothetical protein